MITTESLQKAAEDLYENIEIEFVKDNPRSYWLITTLDPEEIDENTPIAKLYDDFTLEIKNLITWDLREIFEEDEERLRKRNAEEFLDWVVDCIRQEIKEYISYYETLIDYFK